MFGGTMRQATTGCTVKPMSEGEAFFDTNVVPCTVTIVIDASHQISTFDEDQGKLTQ